MEDYKTKIIMHAKGFAYRLMKYPRMIFHKIKSRKNNNTSPTILCNNCTAGWVLHDLSLQFRTPTINTLFYSFDEFYLFVQNLQEVKGADLHEIESVFPYPVATIKLSGGGRFVLVLSIIIHLKKQNYVGGKGSIE